MKMRGSLIVALALAIVGCAGLEPRSDRTGGAERLLSLQLLVTMRQDAGISVALLGDPGSLYLRRRAYGPTPSVDRMLDEIAEDYEIRRVKGWYISAVGQYCEVYELRPGQNIDEIIRRIGADPRVELAQAMNVFETQGIHYDDPYFSMQPALSELAIESAHEMATGRGVTVAVIDSTVDGHHPEFRGRMRLQRDLVDGRSAHRAEVHGTAVAGVIGSMANNGEGIVGVAPDVEIASLRACWTVDDATGRANCSSFSLAQALESAIQMNADIINLSLSGPPDPLLAELIESAIRSGAIVVAAIPDDGDETHAFPASLPHVIAAESSESPASRAASNLVRAPGAEVISTAPNDSYAFFSGNSMSAAYIAGVSALVRQRRPEIGSDELLRLLEETATTDSVNACRAIARAAARGDCSNPGD
jgi:subtilisin family serine protease